MYTLNEVLQNAISDDLPLVRNLKDQNMTLKEIYQALADGKSIRHESWDKHRRICVGEYELIYETGEPYHTDFLTPACWSIYEEQPPRSEEPEDLDKQIEDKRMRVSMFMANSAASHAILDLIEVMIKKVQLK